MPARERLAGLEAADEIASEALGRVEELLEILRRVGARELEAAVRDLRDDVAEVQEAIRGEQAREAEEE